MKRLFCALLVAGLVAGAASAECLRLTTAAASAAVETRGARVLSCRLNGEELFWNDNPVQVEATGWAHGGLPICWPWFGKDADLVFHGTAWKSEFTVVRQETGDFRSALVLRLAKDGDEITVAYTLTDRLRVDVTLANRGSAARTLSFGLHPYFAVSERDAVFVHGFRPAVHQVVEPIDDVEPVADPANGRFLIADRSRHLAIELRTEGWPFVNLWNPGEPPPDMPGVLPAEAWRRFVCLEPLWRQRQPLVLKPGETRSFGAEFAFVPVSGEPVPLAAKPIGGAKTHFAGEDPRVPGFTSKVFGKKPFKVMFIGAHPDDPDFQCGALAHKVKKAGGEAVFVSCCNGNKGHQWMASDELAARRYLETQASAKTLGIDRYLVLGYPDCEIRPDQTLQDRLTRLIRQEAPNLLVTHRTSDYHVDHRNVGIAVRDATYLIGVPLYCPDTPVPETLPFVMYGGDGFREPAPFRADLVCGDDDVLDVLLEAWACHESQEFEWLPPEHGIAVSDVPKDHAGRIRLIRERMMPGRPTDNGRRHRREIDAAWGGKGPTYAEVFELCPYARPPVREEIDFLLKIGCKWLGEPVK